MATCFAKNAVTARSAIKYNTNKDGHARDSDKVLVSGITCDGENAEAEMRAMRKLYGKDKGLQAYTFLQSFSPDDCKKLTMLEANEIGKSTLSDFMAKRGYPEGSYQATIATHCDGESGLLHNHFVINNINLDNGKKLGNMTRPVFDFRKASDVQCKQHGLSVVGENEKTTDAKYTQAEKALLEKGVLPWKEKIRQALDEDMQFSQNAEELKRRLALRGIGMEMRGKKHVTFSYEGKKVRGRTLGSAYDREAIDGLSQRYAGRAVELHVNWESVEKAHPEMKNQKARVARDAVTLWDNAARKAGHKVKRTSKNEMNAEFEIMKTTAILVKGGVAIPLRATGKALQGVGKAVGYVPVVGAPLKVVFGGAGSAMEKTGKAVGNVSDKVQRKAESMEDKVQQALDEMGKSKGMPAGSIKLSDLSGDDGLKNWALMTELEKEEIQNKELARSI